MEESRGIGNVANQPFSHVSFWAQLHNVPLMCTGINTIREMGSKIGRVEDVATDEIDDFFGEYIRVRIAIDIMKRLKKILRIQQENMKEILVGEVYKKLPDYCFCCGYIGQYKGCTKYKGQPKENLAYGAWLKAVFFADRMKFHKSKDKDRREQRKFESSKNTKTPYYQQPNSTKENESRSVQCRDVASNLQMISRHVQEETEKPSMIQGVQSRMDQLGCKKQSDAVGFEEISKNMCQKSGIMSGSKNVEGKKESQDPLTSREAQQLNSAQMSLVEEVVDSVSCLKKPKSKWRRWKNQARSARGMINNKM